LFVPDDSEGGASVVTALEEFLLPSLPSTVTVKDPSLQVLALLRLLHGLNRHWSTLYEVYLLELLTQQAKPGNGSGAPGFHHKGY